MVFYLADPIVAKSIHQFHRVDPNREILVSIDLMPNDTDEASME